MAPKQKGPFRISEVLGLVTYWLDLPPTWQIHNIFHAVLLMPYIKNKVHRPNFLWPPPDIENDKEQWEVKAILNHQQCSQGYQYYILHMERMADHWCNMGTCHMFWKWWQNHTPGILTPTLPINEPAIMPNKEILTITFTFPAEDLVDPCILAQTNPYIHATPPPPPTLLQCITQKASTTFKGALPSEEIFITPLSWWPPIWLPHIPFKSIFPLPKTLPQSSPIIHLGQQIQCIASYIDLVNKMLCDSTEPRRYQYLSDSELWYDSILKLKWDFTFNFDYLENMYKSKDEQPQDPNQF